MTMQLQFEHHLDYQLAAIDAVCDIFAGQEVCRTDFTVTAPRAAYDADPAQGDLLAGQETSPSQGVGNRLMLLDDELLANLRKVQIRQGLRPSETMASRDFTVEMETGTGKTYVYLRSIFELNRRYGFSKFVIVVPSVAIKEGVYKSLQIMAPGFRTLYGGQPFDYFLYDSAKPSQVRNFAVNQHLQIMVVTVGAINKREVNNLYKPNEKTGDAAPIELIRETHPVLIVDEPQSVDGGLQGSGKAALEAMHPLCTLRYSATHVDKHHMVFKLDAIDAYERQLVKQIEVAAPEVEGAHNKAYVRLLEVRAQRGTLLAQLELDVEHHGSVSRKTQWVQHLDDLEELTNRAIYAGMRVGEIRRDGGGTVEITMPGAERWLSKGAAIGDVDDDAVKRQMIRRTIKHHLDKEQRLGPQGIKVLSLFFIDKVDHYRQYAADGTVQKGKYAHIFEEEYTRLARSPTYQSLFGEVDLTIAAADAHEGYFAIDRRGALVDTELNAKGELRNEAGRESAERAYNLIMKDKEKLLDFATPLKFIFSHSALREGWDNPNVFQICNLREMNTERLRRQTIGRGLRLCVNQQGERLRGFAINTLTVIADESYESFAESLQREIEQDTGIRFGFVEDHQFAMLAVKGADGELKPMGVELSKALWTHLKDSQLIDAKGKVQDSLRSALKSGKLELPEAFAGAKPQVMELLRKMSGKLEIKNADEARPVPLRREVFLSPEFQSLWDRIKHRTTYRVRFDNDALIEDCAKALRDDAPPIAATRMRFRTAQLAVGRGGVDATQTEQGSFVSLEEHDIVLPDLLTELQDRTQLTRKSIVRILIESRRLNDFKRNPQQFIEMAGEWINRTKRRALVDGIKYQRIGGSDYYAQECFENQELRGYLADMLAVKKSVHEQVVVDSGVERAFAKDLERNEAVKLYAKLPGWFKVPTPLGNYNPDWAVLVDRDGEEKLYFVVETKGSLFDDALRDAESAKIACGREHFGALSTGGSEVGFVRVTNVGDFEKHW